MSALIKKGALRKFSNEFLCSMITVTALFALMIDKLLLKRVSSQSSCWVVFGVTAQSVTKFLCNVFSWITIKRSSIIGAYENKKGVRVGKLSDHALMVRRQYAIK